jgi:hypothetical protein
VVTIDTRGLTKFADVRFQGDCTVARGIATCRDTLESVGRAEDHSVALRHASLTVIAKKGAALGDAGRYTVTAKAAGLRIVGGSGRVEVGGPALKVAPLVQRADLRVGSTVPLPVRFSDVGSRPAEGVQAGVLLSPGLTFARQYGNCDYGSDDQGFTEAICRFGHTMGLGETDDLSSAFAVHLDSRALRLEILAMAGPMAASLNQFPSHGFWHRGSGGMLGLHVVVPPYVTNAPGGQVPLFGTVLGDSQFTRWSARNAADFGVLGAKASGWLGSVVPVTLGLRVNGPATLLADTTPIPFLRFTLLPGVTTVRVPAACWTDTTSARTYDCGFWGSSSFIVPAGDRASFTFGLRVDKLIRNAQGLALLAGQHPFDPNPRNDQALVTLN